jgi:hypothetical protein
MTQLQLRSDSSEQARLLLEAWNGGDPTTLQRQLESAVRFQPAADLPWVEFERRDLLDGIVENMRNAINRASEGRLACDVEVSVQLLHHLVAEAPAGY